MKKRPFSCFINNVLRAAEKKYWRHLSFEPNIIQIELTNRCNYRCQMCPLKDSYYPKIDMESGLFKKIIDDIAQWNPGRKSLVLHVFGEPFLHKDIFDFLDYLSDKLKDCKIYLSSNFAAVNREILERLFRKKDYNLNIGIYVDAVTEETHAKQRGAGYFKVISNIDYLIELKKKYNSAKLEFHVGMIVTRYNEKEVKPFIGLWQKKLCGLNGAEIRVTLSNSWAGQVPPEAVFLKKEKMFNYRRVCIMPFRMMVVFSNGDAGLCCYDVNHKTGIGNVREENLKSLWASQRAASFRERMKSFELDSFQPCQECRDYNSSIIKLCEKLLFPFRNENRVYLPFKKCN